MPNNLLSKCRHIFFNELGDKFNTKSLKKLMDFLYVLFEKIAIEFDFLSKNYIDLYKEIVEKEIKLAKIKTNDKVLVIGCGSLPVTSILLKEKTKANIDSIDIDKNAIKNAIIFHNKNNFNTDLDFIHADGANHLIEKYDVILILYGIKQQRQIFEYVSLNMKENARIMFRTGIESDKKDIENIKELEKYFKVVQKIKSKTLFPVGTYLLNKSTN